MPIIVVTCTSGGLAGRRFEFDKDRVTIGRRDTNDLVLAPNDTAASSDHCELRYQAGRWVLADRASTNGTLVDGREITGEMPVKTGLLFELGENGPVIMLDLPEVPVSRSFPKPSFGSAPRGFNQQETVAPGDVENPIGHQSAPPKDPVAGVHAAVPAGVAVAHAAAASSPSPATAAPAAVGGERAAPIAAPPKPSANNLSRPQEGIAPPGPSTGRTAFYMALMTDTVQKSSKRLKLMIGALALLLVGVVAFAVVMALRVQEGEDKQAALEANLKSTGEKLNATTDALTATQEALAKAEKGMGDARLKLATTAGKIADLRLAIDTAKGDAKRKLEAQAKALEKTQKGYEEKLKAQAEALAKLKNRQIGGAQIAKHNDKALFMLIAPTDNKGGQSGFCTAFAIHPDGVLATNSHCLRTIEGLNREGKTAIARMNRSPQTSYVVSRWSGHPRHTKLLSEDVALVWLDTRGQKLPRTVTLAATAKVQRDLAPGKPVYTMGYPGKVMNEANPAADFRAAVISRLTDFDNRPGNPGASKVVWHSALTSKGTSGSPIFDADGEVIAVNTGGLSARQVQITDKKTGSKSEQTVYDATGLNFGVRVDALRELMATNGIKLPAGQ